MHSLIIFASGRGSNAQAIIDHFRGTGKAKVSLIVSNKADAGVIDIANKEHIPYLVIDKHTIKQTLLVEQLLEHKPDLIVLAGFMWKVPDQLVHAFPDKIINIHPALLPAYGGKGMYGAYVHAAVLNAKEEESGITIHYVNEVYDSGDIIVQARCKVLKDDDLETLANRIHLMEHFFYPRTVEYILDKN